MRKDGKSGTIPRYGTMRRKPDWEIVPTTA